MRIIRQPLQCPINFGKHVLVSIPLYDYNNPTRHRPSAPLQTSFGSILTPIGVSLLGYGFGAFFQLLPGSSISSIMLIYGFPLSLLGFALSYAQLDPVPCRSTQAALDLRESQATDIQKQVNKFLLLKFLFYFIFSCTS